MLTWIEFRGSFQDSEGSEPEQDRSRLGVDLGNADPGPTAELSYFVFL